MNKSFYEFEAHGRHITICILSSKWKKYRQFEIRAGMSICAPSDKKALELGRHIAEGRARSDKSNSKSVILLQGGIKQFIGEDKYFIDQVARSYFFDFKHNPEKYIAGFNRVKEQNEIPI